MVQCRSGRRINIILTSDRNKGFIAGLNRYERALLDYLESHPEEGRHWRAKVAQWAARDPCPAQALTEELWSYVRERAEHAEPFREWAARGGILPSSLRNLAEYLLRVWGPPVVRRPPRE